MTVNAILAAEDKAIRPYAPGGPTWAEPSYHKLIYFHEVDKGGHFAAWEQPPPPRSEQRSEHRADPTGVLQQLPIICPFLGTPARVHGVLELFSCGTENGYLLHAGRPKALIKIQP